MDQQRRNADAKLVALDAVRGIAAFFVFAGHFCEGMLPGVTKALNGTIAFAVLNGPAAVVVFFVLSGFVLALGPLHAGWRGLARLAIKRWPRLAGPVTIASLGYYAAWQIGLMPAARYGMSVPNAPPFVFASVWQDEHKLNSVLREALLTTFTQGTADHNPVLWTMHWEALGSILTIALVAVILIPRLPIWLRVALFAGLSLAAARYNSWLLGFPVGVAGALWHRDRGATTRVPGIVAIAMLALATVLLSWDLRNADGLWRWAGGFTLDGRVRLWMIVQSVAAALCILTALYNPLARRLLSGRVGGFAGRLSFAFYLTHILAIYTVAAWLFIWWGRAGWGPTPFTDTMLFALTTIAATALAIPLMRFDRWWLRVLARIASRIIGRPDPKSL